MERAIGDRLARQTGGRIVGRGRALEGGRSVEERTEGCYLFSQTKTVSLRSAPCGRNYLVESGEAQKASVDDTQRMASLTDFP